MKTLIFSLILAFAQVSTANAFFLGGIANNPVNGENDSPSTISGIVLRLRTSDSITYNGSNQISQFTDKSGNGYHFTQSTTGNKPTRSAAAVNGKDMAAFDRTAQQYAEGPATVILDRTNPWTIYTVKKQTLGFYPTIWSFKGASKAVILINDDNAAAGTRLDFGNNDFYFSFTTPGNDIVYSTIIKYAGGGATTLSNYSAKVNCSTVTLNQSHAIGNTVNNQMLGAHRADNYTWNGQIGEVIVYNKATSGAEDSLLCSYGTAHYGITP